MTIIERTCIDAPTSVAEPIAAGLPALPDGVTGSETALVFCRELTVDEWKTLGRELSQSERTLAQSERSIQWWIGDWWCYGNHSYGQRKAIVEAKKVFGRKFKTLANYGTGARSVETSDVGKICPFSPSRGRQAETGGAGPLVGGGGRGRSERNRATAKNLRR